MIALQIKLSPLSSNSIPQGKKVRKQFGKKVSSLWPLLLCYFHHTAGYVNHSLDIFTSKTVISIVLLLASDVWGYCQVMHPRTIYIQAQVISLVFYHPPLQEQGRVEGFLVPTTQKH